MVNLAEKAHEIQKWLLRSNKEEGIKIGIKRGLEQGREQGLEQGREQGKLQTIREFKLIGVPIEKIIKAAGVTREVIEKLE